MRWKLGEVARRVRVSHWMQTQEETPVPLYPVLVPLFRIGFFGVQGQVMREKIREEGE